ncbi:Xaa-Pro dipeptidase [uncultured archaeon]|nr:Xaa-Pro dipeptidase [uncultured archaeon]
MGSGKEVFRRTRKLQASLEDAGEQALLVGNRRNVFYLTGKDAGRIVVTPDESVLFVRPLYRQLYSSLYGRGFPHRVVDFEEGAIKGFLKKEGVRKVCLDSGSAGALADYRKRLGVRVSVSDLVERQRAVKSDFEVDLIKKSCRIAHDAVYFAGCLLKPGKKELDVVADVEAFIRRRGSETPSFDDGMLLASGRRSADIHARPGLFPLLRGPVVVDLGAKIGGYNSDVTRTFGFGRLTAREKEVMDFVRELQQSAADLVRPGAVAGDVHKFAEEELKKAGFMFHHNLGHGVGLDIHELPNLSGKSEDVFKPGMVITVEPGVYLPRHFGVRHEDTFLVTKSKPKNLTA